MLKQEDNYWIEGVEMIKTFTIHMGID